MQHAHIDNDRRDGQEVVGTPLFPHMAMCPCSFHDLLLSGIITADFREARGWTVDNGWFFSPKYTHYTDMLTQITQLNVFRFSILSKDWEHRTKLT